MGRRENIKPTLFNKLIRTGEIDSFVLGSRYRYVPLESWRAYLERCRRNESRDPVEKAAAAAAYRESCKLHGVQAAARARAGWTNPGVAPARRSSTNHSASSRQTGSLLIDPAEHAKQAAEWSAALAEARHAFHDTTGKIPPATDNEVRVWLQSALPPSELANWPRTKDGHLSIEHSILIRAADVPYARLVFTIRHNQTLLQNFGESWLRYINPVTGRIHGNFRVASAGPGRFAASAPNLQQLPIRRNPGFRRCVGTRRMAGCAT